MRGRFSGSGIAAMVVIAAALVLPIAIYDEDYVFWSQFPTAGALLLFGLFSLVMARYRVMPDFEKRDLKPKL